MSKYLIILFLVFCLIGCATTVKRKEKSDAYQLQDRLREVEFQLEQKDEEIRALQEELENIKREISSPITAVEYSKPTNREIQIALKNANFYQGPIDGKIGKQTINAIKEFQKANGLKADGIVGYKTWMKLKEYLKQ
ncbi:MAG: peptidoglycan-binding protein [Candidatus Omnitrophica bacterium]|nr:peptidoglycan-binding protein [Candidatus Omnitrophota bacterium]